jgi:hypothetical protein
MSVVQIATFSKGSAVLVIDGCEVLLGEKSTLMDKEGMAVLVGLEVGQTMPTSIMGVRASAAYQYDWYANGTTHPVVVVLARRWVDAVNNPDFKSWGDQPIPTMEEADAELANPPAGWSVPDYL